MKEYTILISRIIKIKANDVERAGENVDNILLEKYSQEAFDEFETTILEVKEL